MLKVDTICFKSKYMHIVFVSGKTFNNSCLIFNFCLPLLKLGKMRLTIPCRALTCSHLQCFDATLYIQMNEKKPTWVCPVCDKKAPYEHLIIDGYVTLKFFLVLHSNHLLKFCYPSGLGLKFYR